MGLSGVVRVGRGVYSLVFQYTKSQPPTVPGLETYFSLVPRGIGLRVVVWLGIGGGEGGSIS